MSGSTEMLATARTPSTAGKPITAGPPATASLKAADMQATPGTPRIAGRPATVTHQELKGCQQQQECLQQFGCKPKGRNAVKSEKAAAAGTTASSWMSSAAGPLE